MSPNSLPLEQETRVISLPIFFIRSGKRKMAENEDEEDEYPVKKEKLYLQKQGIFLLMLTFIKE